MKFKIVALLKDFILFTRIPSLFSFIYRPLKFVVNAIGLSRWINKHNADLSFNDFFRGKRVYTQRQALHQYVIDKEGLNKDKIDYLEFGVFGGTSFKWWLKNQNHLESKFFGFDTFEGLPEDWFLFKKGDMSMSQPELDDDRGQFIKGLFQETLGDFLRKNYSLENRKSAARKVIHMDADLFSSTLFVLTSLAPYLNDGDIIFFDEFSVPNHEFAAWETFVASYYVDYEVLGAVNNYYQIAIKYKGIKVN
ncbi:MAG TPA: class I SAM-dependent methyltransferase [Edaphocola sp.]|nr:class I SAM-dependent methyltransferase [Edaphocola sp.]